LSPQLKVVAKKILVELITIKALEELICITEGKLHQVVMGFAQNLIQCESALQVNKKYEKALIRAKHLGMTTTISIESSQQPRSGILSYSPWMGYLARVRTPSIFVFPSLP